MDSSLPVGTNPQELMASMEPREEKFEFNGKIWTFMVRDLPWRVKKRAISDATSYLQEGGVRFSFDIYYRECLKTMLIKAPFNLDEVSWSSLDAAFGEMLERLVPTPFPASDVSAVKNVPEAS